MTKTELKTAIDKAGGVRSHGASEWNEAFNQYNQANRNAQLRRGTCGSCYRKVYEWLSQ